VAIHQFAECITCHAWSPDQSSNALFPFPARVLDLTVPIGPALPVASPLLSYVRPLVICRFDSDLRFRFLGFRLAPGVLCFPHDIECLRLRGEQSDACWICFAHALVRFSLMPPVSCFAYYSRCWGASLAFHIYGLCRVVVYWIGVNEKKILIIALWPPCTSLVLLQTAQPVHLHMVLICFCCCC
jgi:hypothetical protein